MPAISGLAVLAVVLNAITTDDHLPKTIMNGYWPVAGMDLLLLGGGALAALTARRLARRALVRVAARPPSRRIPRPAVREALLLIGVLATAYGGFALLALSQIQHWRQVLDAPPPASRQLRILRALGGAAIGLSLALALLRDGPSFGALLWTIGISLAALAVAFTLAWRPGWLRPLAVLGKGLAGRS